MCPYSTTPSEIMFDANVFKPRYLGSVYRYMCSFIIIAKNVEAAFRVPIGITLHHLFP